MRRKISSICALSLLIGGLYMLGGLIMPDITDWASNGYHGPPVSIRVLKGIIMVPVMMVVIGAFWLWEDFRSPAPPRQKSGSK